MRIPGLQRATLNKLLGIVQNLYKETENFLEQGDEQQLWYNRGYANGIVQTLKSLGYTNYIDDHLEIIIDPADIAEGHKYLAWGKAYQHGFEVAKKDTSDVLPGV